MNLSVTLVALVLTLFALVAFAQRPTSYRRRHLTPFDQVCNSTPTSAPYTPTAAPYSYSTGKGKGKGSTTTGGKGKGGSSVAGKGGTTAGKAGTTAAGKGGTTPAGKGGTTPAGKGGTTAAGKGGTTGGTGGGTTGGGGGYGYRTRQLQTITLNTTLAVYDSYPLSASFSGFALLTWPNFCFSATVSVTNFVANCVGCKFLVTDDSGMSCSNIAAATPFVDLTEVPYDPYSNSTFFTTDSSGNAIVVVPVICTGTGPLDNFERPFLLLDSSDKIAACGILSYKCS